MARLILDTSVLIDLGRHRQSDAHISPSDDLAIAAVTLAELRHGALAGDPSRRRAREQMIRDIEDGIHVLTYARSTAAEHAVLLDHVKRTGKPRGAHDLIIAAHARETRRQVVTRDVRARFGGLPGVEVPLPD